MIKTMAVAAGATAALGLTVAPAASADETFYPAICQGVENIGGEQFHTGWEVEWSTLVGTLEAQGIDTSGETAQGYIQLAVSEQCPEHLEEVA